MTVNLPSGTKIVGPDGILLAVVKNDLWSNTAISAKDFAFSDGKEPHLYSGIPVAFLWGIRAARVKLGIYNQDDVDELAMYKKLYDFPNPIETE